MEKIIKTHNVVEAIQAALAATGLSLSDIVNVEYNTQNLIKWQKTRNHGYDECVPHWLITFMTHDEVKEEKYEDALMWVYKTEHPGNGYVKVYSDGRIEFEK